MPQWPVTRIRETFLVGATTTYENNDYRLIRGGPPKGLNLLPHEEAMIRILENAGHDDRYSIDFLGDRVYGLSTLTTPEDQSYWFFHLRDLGDCHWTWVIYKSAARFLQNPSKESLAKELRTIAPWMNSEVPRPGFWGQTQIPWPLAACINMCDNEMDALEMARKADTGELGDQKQWLAAEHRWRTIGVTEHDLVSMSDERLPFDCGIDSEGFPIALSLWQGFQPALAEVGALTRLLSLHGEMERCKARTLVAGLVEVCFISASMVIGSDEADYPIALDVAKIRSVVEDLPSGRSIPLHAVVNLLSGSDEEILEFFRCLAAAKLNSPFTLFQGFSIRMGSVD